MFLFYGDFHLHAREATTPEFKQVIPVYTAYSAGLYMMNFKDPLDLSDIGAAVAFLHDYEMAIKDIAKSVGHEHHRVLLMPCFANTWQPKELDAFIKSCEANEIPLAGFKYFCQGQSTNAGYAPSVKQAAGLINVVAEHGKPMAFHLEDPDEPDVLKKEKSAVEKILPRLICRDGRRLDGKFSIEHISTEHSLKIARSLGLHYTITPHHMGLYLPETNAAWIARKGDRPLDKFLQSEHPLQYCKPIIQTKKNQQALLKAWVEGDDFLMTGSDSAPHVASKKFAEPASERAAGIYLGDSREAYAKAAGCPSYILDKDRLTRYSMNAARFYGLENLSDAREPYASDLSAEKDRVITAALALQSCKNM